MEGAPAMIRDGLFERFPLVAGASLVMRKGTYRFLGNGDGPMVHHPQYVLDQRILPMGAAYWVVLTEGRLGRDGAGQPVGRR